MPALLPLLSGAAMAQQIANVLQPSDHIIGSSANTPTSEGVANAIDGTEAKYLNFDGGTGPCGFIVTPQVGATLVSGLAMQSANDTGLPGDTGTDNRDPKIVTIEGSSDPIAGNGWNASTNWTMIFSNTITEFTNRFQWETNYFTNSTQAFSSYRWTSVQVWGTTANSMQISEVQLLGRTVPPNVLQPSDPIIGSSANTPTSEGVANAIDGTEAKYLNFDGGTGPCGFIVTPSVGATVAEGLAMQSANDTGLPGDTGTDNRDPKIVTVEGSNDPLARNGWNASTNWTMLFSNSITEFTNRFQWETNYFQNEAPYTSYRWTSVQVWGTTANSMQISEVQILGVSAPVNVIIPSDPIIGSSANTPTSEGVANAIDGTEAKYLNFDGGTGPCGFIVTPSAGATTITGLGMQSANDTGLPGDTGTDNRDPKIVTVEGSNDPLARNGWTASTNWTLLYTNNSWPLFTNRFEWEYDYFPNVQPFTSYRWTSWQVQGTTANSMQISEVQLLAVTSKADCTKAAFTSTPSDTPVLSGSTAEFFSSVNGPWPLQWFTNGVAVPGANKATFTTGPITAANTNIAYTVGIVGCSTTPAVHAVLFTPSPVQSIGISFAGSGANGAPAYILTNDIVGVQPQAFWNICSNGAGNLGSSGDGSTMSTLVDSSNNPTAITFNFNTSGSWGVGTDISKPVGRLLNGVAGATATGTPQTMTFGNVPAGNYSVIAYSIAPPLEFQEQYFTMTNTVPDTNIPTIFEQTLASGQYNTAPGFYTATSTNIAKPSIANVVRFNNVQPDSSGSIELAYAPTAAVTGGRTIGVNAIQLLVNPPAVGSPPIITTEPQFTVAASNGVLQMTVDATGNNLTYQWRLNGANIFNGGAYSGVNEQTLTVSPFTQAEAGVYSVAIFDAAGSTISANASAAVTDYNITNQLVAYWPYDQTTGSNALSGVAGGPEATFSGTVAWTNGVISNAVTLDGSTTYGFAPSFTLASNAISGATWVSPVLPLNIAGNVALFRNMQGDFVSGGGAITTFGQFSLDLNYDGGTGFLIPTATIGIGNNYVTAAAPASDELVSNGWHHVAFSADGAQLALYLDGTNVSTVPYTGNINLPTQPWISIGARLVTNSAPPPLVVVDGTNPNMLQGNLDDMALWTRALTASEVSAIYQAGLKGQPLTSVVETPTTSGATLAATVSGGNIVISWAPAGGRLESTPALLPGGTVWTVVGNGTNNPATVTIGKGDSFFRIVNP